MAESASVEPFGDAAVLIRLGDRVDAELADRAQRIAVTLDRLRAEHPALGRSIPAHASVLLPIDPLAVDLDAALAIARSAVAGAALEDATPSHDDPAIADREPIEISVRYGGEDGPDLIAVAEAAGLAPADVVDLHTAATYHVLFLGFAPGFGYLDGLPSALATRRRATPRERVPAGSVAIAGGQTAVYPRSMPGGWNVIGRTDRIMFDPLADRPALLNPGSIVRFTRRGGPVTGTP